MFNFYLFDAQVALVDVQIHGILALPMLNPEFSNFLNA